MDRQEIIDDILSGIDMTTIDFTFISLISVENKLINNIQKNISDGIRTEESIKEAVDRLNYFKNFNSTKIDTSQLSIEETVAKILKLIF